MILVQQDLDFTAFYDRVTVSLKVEKLKIQGAEPELVEFFIENKMFLAQIFLFQIATVLVTILANILANLANIYDRLIFIR